MKRSARWNEIVSLAVLFFFTLFSCLPQSALANNVIDPGTITAQNGSFTSVVDGNKQIISADADTILTSPSLNIAAGSLLEVACGGNCLWNVTNETSQWFGDLSSLGRWIFTNPLGFDIGSSARLDVSGSLILSTLGISNENFLEHQFIFEQNPAFDPARIISQGTISLGEGSSLGFLSQGIEHTGSISGRLDAVSFGAGEKITVSFDEAGLISLVIDKGLEHLLKDENGNMISGIRQAGRIQAEGGRVQLSAKAFQQTLDLLVNNEGVIEAQKAEVLKNGSVAFVEGLVEIDSNGAVENTGTILTDHLLEIGYTFRNYGILDGGKAVFDNLDHAAFISGVLGMDVSDLGHIIINGNLTLTSNVTLTSDSDNSGGEGVSQLAGFTINGGGFNLTVRSGSDETHGTGDVTLRDVNNVNNLTVTAGGGNINSLGVVAAQAVYFAAGGNIAVMGNLTAQGTGGSNGMMTLRADRDGNNVGSLVFANGVVLTVPGGCSGNGNGYSFEGANSFDTYGGNKISTDGKVNAAALSNGNEISIFSMISHGDANSITSDATLNVKGTHTYEADGAITVKSNLSGGNITVKADRNGNGSGILSLLSGVTFVNGGCHGVVGTVILQGASPVTSDSITKLPEDPLTAILINQPLEHVQGVKVSPASVIAAPASSAFSEETFQPAAGMQKILVGNLEGINAVYSGRGEPVKTFRWNEPISSFASVPEGGNVYAVLPKSRTLLVIDGNTLELKKKWEGVLDPESTDIAVSPGERFAYVASAESDTVKVIDLIKGEAVRSFETGSEPSKMAMTQDGRYLFVTNRLDRTISKINTQSGIQEAVFQAGSSPYGIVLANDEQELFVTDTSANSVLVFDSGIIKPDTVQVMKKAAETVEEPMPQIQMDVTTAEAPNGTASVAGQAPSPKSFIGDSRLPHPEPILVFTNASPYQLQATIPVGIQPYGITLDEAGKRILISNRGSNSITVIDLVTKSVSAEIQVGQRPSGIIILPETQRAFVANELSGTVSLVDLQQASVLQNISGGILPSQIILAGREKAIS